MYITQNEEVEKKLTSYRIQYESSIEKNFPVNLAEVFQINACWVQVAVSEL